MRCFIPKLKVEKSGLFTVTFYLKHFPACFWKLNTLITNQKNLSPLKFASLTFSCRLYEVEGKISSFNLSIIIFIYLELGELPLKLEYSQVCSGRLKPFGNQTIFSLLNELGQILMKMQIKVIFDT
jgi:hypothetical protein